MIFMLDAVKGTVVAATNRGYASANASVWVLDDFIKKTLKFERATPKNLRAND